MDSGAAGFPAGCPGATPNMIGPVRHNPSTVVVLAGRPGEQVLAAVGRSLNVVLVRPEPASSAGADDAGGEAEAAAGALRRAAGISAAYVLVAADPLAAVAEAWQAMWALTGEARGSDEFELRAAEAMGAWRAKRFELPDYYLVLADESGPGGASAPGAFGAPGAPGGSGASGGSGESGAGEVRADFYLGPLRAVRPNRVAVAAGASPAAQADALLTELGSLRHGPWWPPLDEVIRTARGFYPGSLAESPTAGRASLLR
jgi:hypothetical protein